MTDENQTVQSEPALFLHNAHNHTTTVLVVNYWITSWKSRGAEECVCFVTVLLKYIYHTVKNIHHHVHTFLSTIACIMRNRLLTSLQSNFLREKKSWQCNSQLQKPFILSQQQAPFSNVDFSLSLFCLLDIIERIVYKVLSTLSIRYLMRFLIFGCFKISLNLCFIIQVNTSVWPTVF